MNSSSAPLRFTQSFEANLKDLPAMLKFARTHIAKCGFDVRDGQRFETAREAALTPLYESLANQIAFSLASFM